MLLQQGIAKRVVLEAAGAKVGAIANFVGTTPAKNLYLYDVAVVALKVTAAATEAGDTLDVFVDTSFDGGATWHNVVHFPQVLGNTAIGTGKTYTATLAPAASAGTATTDTSADAAAGAVRPTLLGDQLRVRWTIVDAVTTGNASFTFGVTAFLHS